MRNPLIPGASVWRNRLVAMLAALSCGLLSTLHAGSISAYRDASGRVVFVNEKAPSEAAGSPADSPVTKAKQTDYAPLKGESEARATPLVSPGRWDDMIEGTAHQHRVDPNLVRAIVRVESNFNPFAISSRGARGLMQLVPATARRFGVKNIFDPKSNLDGGVRYLKHLMELFGGDLKLSLAAYNAGENAVDRHSGVPPFPETQDYLRKISEIYPLSSPRRIIAATGIGKYVDNNGIVHFSNTDLP